MRYFNNTFSFFIAFFLCCFAAIGQENQENNIEELVVEGKYAGEALYVYNPSYNEGYSVQNVWINGKKYDYVQQSNAFEISLANYHIDDYVVVQITYMSGSVPVIINAESLVKESEFSIPSFTYNKKTKMIVWKTSEMQKNSDYRLEQLLYGKWVEVKELGTPDEMISEQFIPVLLSGRNTFRLKQIDEEGNILTSQLIYIKSPNLKVLLVTDKVKDFIEFTAVTHYELYDNNGFFIKRGTAQKVNVSDLKKGSYWINFDGKETIIMKK